MAKKLIIFLVIFSFILMPSAKAGFNVNLNRYGEDFQISDRDLVDLVCYKTLADAGEGLAIVRVVNEVLVPAYESLHEKVFSGYSEPKIIFQAKRIDQLTMPLVQEMCQTDDPSVALKNSQKIENRLKSEVSGWDGSAFMDRLQEDLKKEAEKLKEQIEEQLKNEARALKEQKEKELRDKAKELEQQARNEIASQLSQMRSRASEGAYGTDPDTVRNYVKQQIDSLAEQKESQLKAQLQADVEQFKKEMRTELEAKAEEMGGEKREAIDDAKEAFEGMQEKVQGKFEEYKADYQGYDQKYLNKKKGLIKQAIEKQIGKAEEKIMEKKEQIDLAIENGYDIKPAEEFVSELQAEEQKLLDFLAKEGDVSEEELAEAVDDLRTKYIYIQEEMARLEAQSSQQALNKLITKIGQNRVRIQIEEALRKHQTRLPLYESQLARCNELEQTNPTQYENTFACQNPQYPQNMIDKMKLNISEMQDALSLLDQVDKLSADQPVAEIVSFAKQVKNRLLQLKSSVNEIYEMQEEYRAAEREWISGSR